MNNLDRPVLTLEAEFQIEIAQNQIHANYWSLLEQMQVGTAEANEENAELDKFLLSRAPTPKSPNGLRRILTLYSSALFESEATFYPNDPRLGYWLRKLAERVTARTLETVSHLEVAGRKRKLSLEHHGVTQSDMRATISTALNADIEAQTKTHMMTAIADQIKARLASPTVKEAKPKRMRATIECPAAARKLEAYLRSEGLGQTEFAIKAGTTDRTLRKFRKTGMVKRSIFEGIAKAMGTTKEALLKD
jgi:hypothetical protein